MKELHNLLLFMAICFILYVLFRSFNYNPNSNTFMEGMKNGQGKNSSGNTGTFTAPANGVAGNAAAYAASIKSTTINLQDTLLISKYRADYETAILNLDDLINNLMLQASLNIDQQNPTETIENLAKMQQAKVALNSVMKFVDSQ
jgi:hypothetical protein